MTNVATQSARLFEPLFAPLWSSRYRTHLSSQIGAQALLVGAGSLAIAALAQWRILIPGSPVPITGQTLAVLLVGATLGSRLGVAAVGLYLLEGLVGLPFFQGGGSGPAVLLGPTGGYLVGFLIAAGVMGAFAKHGWDRKPVRAWLAFTIAHFCIFACGVAWLSYFVGIRGALLQGLIPFIPGEIVKSTVAAGTLPSLWSWIHRRQGLK